MILPGAHELADRRIADARPLVATSPRLGAMLPDWRFPALFLACFEGVNIEALKNCLYYLEGSLL